MRLRSFAMLAVALVAGGSALVACSSSSGDSTPTATTDAASNDAASPDDVTVDPSDSGPKGDAASPDDGGLGDAGDGGTSDAGSDAGPTPSAGPVDGTLEAKTAGALPTTAPIGAVGALTGSAQWRPAPFGGGRLAITLVEGAPHARTFELTIYDSDDAPGVDETFPAMAKSGAPPIEGARVETFAGPAAWGTDGDGTVKIKAFSAKSVTLELTGIGQFAAPPATNDTFVLAGTITVPIVDLAGTVGANTTLKVSKPQDEPGGSPLNLSSQADIVGATTLGEEAFPYVGKRRAIRVAEGKAPAGRHVLVSFPSGHLPREGAALPLTKFDRVTIALVDGTTFAGDAGEKIWEADQGTLSVTTRTPTSLVLAVQGARMQSESPDAKGFFTLDGTITVPLP